jgi:hypothetical protein
MRREGPKERHCPFEVSLPRFVSFSKELVNPLSLRGEETAGFVPTLEFPLGASGDPSAFIHPTAPKTKPTMR